jgi:hypothetical protein
VARDLWRTLLTTKKVYFIIEYLCNFYEAICKKAMPRGTGDQIELFDEKTGGRKSRERVTLTILGAVML